MFPTASVAASSRLQATNSEGLRSVSTNTDWCGSMPYSRSVAGMNRNRPKRCYGARRECRDFGREAAEVEVLKTSFLFEPGEHSTCSGSAACGSGHATDRRFVVHRSPIEGVRLRRRTNDRIRTENWRRRPDLNRGWRFCRFSGVVHRVVSCWSLVGPAPPFYLVFGPYWTTSGLRRPVMRQRRAIPHAPD